MYAGASGGHSRAPISAAEYASASGSALYVGGSSDGPSTIVFRNKESAAGGGWDESMRIHSDGDVEIPIAAECLLAVVYVGALFGMHLQFSNPVLAVGAVPIIAIAGGRYWPYIFPLPLLALPIAIKTLRARGGLGSEPSAPTLEIVGCWVFYLVIPLAVCLAAAIYFARRGRSGETGRLFLRWGLVLAAWTYFWLNFAFFNYPWWWTEWGSRSFANWVFTISTLALTFAAIAFHRRHATSSIASSGDSM